MTPKEAFKVAFLHKCAEDGLTKDETLERIRNMRMVKAAAGGAVAGLGGAALGAAGGLASGAWKTLWRLLLLGPAAAGAMGGYGLANAQDETFDEDDARKRELLAAYERAASQLERARSKRMTQM